MAQSSLAEVSSFRGETSLSPPFFYVKEDEGDDFMTIKKMIVAQKYDKNLSIQDSTKEEFLLNNLRLVHHVINRKFSWVLGSMPEIEYDDLVSIGYIGMANAYDRFDTTYGVAFSTYAIPMIYGEFQRFIRDYNPGAKFSRHVKEVGKAIAREQANSEYDELTVEELAERIEKYTVHDIKAGLEYLFARKARSMNETVFQSDGDDITLEEQLMDNDSIDPDRRLILDEFYKTLPKQYIEIMNMASKGMTQGEIGKVVGVSQVQISRIMKKVEEQAIAFGEGHRAVDTKKERKPYKSPKQEQVELARKLLKDPMLSMKKISQMTGLATSTIFNHKVAMKKEGLL
jgi:RNA polymerase sporulation-specific sigma factor